MAMRVNNRSAWSLKDAVQLYLFRKLSSQVGEAALLIADGQHLFARAVHSFPELVKLPS